MRLHRNDGCVVCLFSMRGYDCVDKLHNQNSVVLCESYTVTTCHMVMIALICENIIAITGNGRTSWGSKLKRCPDLPACQSGQVNGKAECDISVPVFAQQRSNHEQN